MARIDEIAADRFRLSVSVPEIDVQFSRPPSLLARAVANDSIDHFDPRSVSGCCAERAVAGDERRFHRFREGDVHGVVCADVVAEPPRTRQKIQVSVTMKIEISEIRDRFVGATGRDFTAPYQSSKPCDYLDVQEVRGVQFVVAAKEAGLHSHSKRSLQQKLKQRRRVDDNHAESRSSRMTTAAGVFRVTRFRLRSRASISSRVGRDASRSSSASR